MNPLAVGILQLVLNESWLCPVQAQLSNAKWQQQRARLSQWCKSQQTSGNVESLRVVREGGKAEARRGGRHAGLFEKERRRDGKGRRSRGDEAGKVEGWGRGAQGADGEADKGGMAGRMNKKWFPRPGRVWTMHSVKSPICQQSASGPLRLHNMALPHFFALIHSHTMSSCTLLSPTVHFTAQWLCYRDWQNRLCVCHPLDQTTYYAKLHHKFRIMQMVSNVCLRWSHDSYIVLE